VGYARAVEAGTTPGGGADREPLTDRMSAARPATDDGTAARAPAATGTPPDTNRPGPRLRRPRRPHPDLLWGLAAAALAVAITIVDLKLWRMEAHVPIFGADGDGAYYFATIKDVLEHGWFWRNPDLAAPFGQVNYDFAAPFGDLVHYLVVTVLGLVLGGDPALVFNAFFLLCFPLIAITAYAVLRDLGAARPAALAAAILFTFLPYHMLRNQTHLFLTAYYSIPVAVWLVVTVAEGRRLIDRSTPRRTLVAVGACLLVGAASNYYAIFALLILLAVVPVAALARRSKAIALQGAVVVALIGASFALCHAPAIIYPLQHGANATVADRGPEESERYALTLGRLVIPRPTHRVGFMAGRGRVYEAHTPLKSEGADPALGSVATLGFLGGLLVLLTTGLGAGSTLSARRMRMAIAGAIALAGFLIGTTGGISALIAYEISPQVRAWGRMSLVIAFAALLVVALALSFLGDRLRARGRPAWVLGLVAAAVGVVGVLDQTAPSDVPDYPTIQSRWKADASFVKTMEDRLPPGTKVLQLPYMSYPENGPLNAISDYDLFKGYLHSTDLRWTYGAVRGRPSDWLGQQQGLAPDRLAAAAAATGFGAVYLDRAGYTDRGEAVATALQALAGPGTSGQSADGRLQFFDLAPAAARLRAKITPAERVRIANALLHPVSARFEDGFNLPLAGESGYRWATSDATIAFENPLDGGRAVQFVTDFVGGAAQPSQVTVTAPGGRRTTFAPSNAGGLPVTLSLRLPHGRSTLRIHTEGSPAPAPPDVIRDQRLRVGDPTIRYAPLDAADFVAAAMP
jgi:hypothetical protein